jgi:hypothetical protein
MLVKAVITLSMQFFKLSFTFTVNESIFEKITLT